MISEYSRNWNIPFRINHDVWQNCREIGSIIWILRNFALARLINSQHARKNKIRVQITWLLGRIINITSSLNAILNGSLLFKSMQLRFYCCLVRYDRFRVDEPSLEMRTRVVQSFNPWILSSLSLCPK